jgi:1-acyl-sn-glycerol-3-phosphate acyltransferase
VNLPLPGYWVRRLVWQPLFWLVCLWLLVFALPFVLVVAAILSFALPGKPHDALLIFPEGGNRTSARRLRGIERLRATGRENAARRAEKIVHLMPPRPGGVHAALIANRELDVVVVAHTGLDQLDSLGDLWRELPMAKTLYLRWHVIDADAIPIQIDGVAGWLLNEWEEMDRWVSEHHSGRTDGVQ